MRSGRDPELRGLLSLKTSATLGYKALIALVANLFWVDRRSKTERLVAYAGETLPASPSVLFIFVRGTFGKSGYGGRWGTVASALRSLSPRPGFLIFKWPGTNGERARRKDARSLAQCVEDLARRWPGTPIVAIGHSHGGSLVRHAAASVPLHIDFTPVMLAAPQIQVRARPTEGPVSDVFALAYTAVFSIPYILLALIPWSMFVTEQRPEHWTWIGCGITVAAVFAMAAPARRARDELCVPEQPQPRCVRHIWCSHDEVFETFAHAEKVRRSFEVLEPSHIERFKELQDTPWAREFAREISMCFALFLVAVIGLHFACVAAMGTSNLEFEADFASIAAALVKISLDRFPLLYRAIGSVTSLGLTLGNAGLVQLCRAQLAGLRAWEGILIETIDHPPQHDGIANFEVESNVVPSAAMTVHTSTVEQPEVHHRLVQIVRDVLHKA